MHLFKKMKNNQPTMDFSKEYRSAPLNKTDLELLQKELKTKQKELEHRGKIIEDIHKQLQDNLAQLIEKIDYANNLEKEFEHTKTILKTKEEDITKLKEELFDRKNNPEYINSLLVILYDEL
jgi:hypothetical protein